MFVLQSSGRTRKYHQKGEADSGKVIVKGKFLCEAQHHKSSYKAQRRGQTACIFLLILYVKLT
jgi:hypothetical protein